MVEGCPGRQAPPNVWAKLQSGMRPLRSAASPRAPSTPGGASRAPGQGIPRGRGRFPFVVPAARRHAILSRCPAGCPWCRCRRGTLCPGPGPRAVPVRGPQGVREGAARGDWRGATACRTWTPNVQHLRAFICAFWPRQRPIRDPSASVGLAFRHRTAHLVTVGGTHRPHRGLPRTSRIAAPRQVYQAGRPRKAKDHRAVTRKRETHRGRWENSRNRMRATTKRTKRDTLANPSQCGGVRHGQAASYGAASPWLHIGAHHDP